MKPDVIVVMVVIAIIIIIVVIVGVLLANVVMFGADHAGVSDNYGLRPRCRARFLPIGIVVVLSSRTVIFLVVVVVIGARRS